MNNPNKLTIAATPWLKGSANLNLEQVQDAYFRLTGTGGHVPTDDAAAISLDDFPGLDLFEWYNTDDDYYYVYEGVTGSLLGAGKTLEISKRVATRHIHNQGYENIVRQRIAQFNHSPRYKLYKS